MSSFLGSMGSSNRLIGNEQEKTAQALNIAEMHKKEARNELRCAKRNMSPDEIMSLARKFYQLVRAHSRCKKIHQCAAGLGTAKCARCECQQNFWPSAKIPQDLALSLNSRRKKPFSFFTDTYHSRENTVVHPDWMPQLSAPTSEFRCDEISLGEIMTAVRKSKVKSAPCPLDGIPSVIFKSVLYCSA